MKISKNNPIKPIEHRFLIPDKIYCFTYKGKHEFGRLLYAFPRRNYFYDDYDQLTGKYEWVAHKVGYIPIKDRFIDIFGDSTKVDSVHICLGRFLIHDVVE